MTRRHYGIKCEICSKELHQEVHHRCIENPAIPFKKNWFVMLGIQQKNKKMTRPLIYDKNFILYKEYHQEFHQKQLLMTKSYKEDVKTYYNIKRKKNCFVRDTELHQEVHHRCIENPAISFKKN